MAKKLWFTSKLYGWGWTPVTWQGWGVTLLFIVIVTTDTLQMDHSEDQSIGTLLPWAVRLILYTVLLCSICWKTGERPRWRWGA